MAAENTNISHISVDIDIWSYVDWDLLLLKVSTITPESL
jgi:hypothetical protein